MVGIYEITAWTDNPASCDSEGPSVIENQFETWFYLRVDDLFGHEFLNAPNCADLAECETAAADDTITFGSGWLFETGSDSKGWRGTTSSASVGLGEQCTGGVTEHLLTSAGDGIVRIESRERMAQPFAPDSEGFCDTDAAAEAAEGQPCIRLEVVTATRRAEL